MKNNRALVLRYKAEMYELEHAESESAQRWHGWYELERETLIVILD